MINFFNHLFSTIRIQDIIDIALVAIIIYTIFKIIKGTRAEQLAKGIIVLLILTKVSEWLEIYTINYILGNLMTLGLVAILIVFQPELRKGLEYIGRRSFTKNANLIPKKENNYAVKELVNAIGSLSRQKIGALIVLRRRSELNEYIESGTYIDGKLSSPLLINIFIPNTPLHDGAVIVKNDRVEAAGCILPLIDDNLLSRDLSRDLGTRHRAAIGISERSDCLSLVVSEETGSISVAEYGKLSRHLDLATLEEILIDSFKSDTNEEEFSFLKRLLGGKDE